MPHLFVRVKGNYHAFSTIHPMVDPEGTNRKAIMDFIRARLQADGAARKE